MVAPSSVSKEPVQISAIADYPDRFIFIKFLLNWTDFRSQNATMRISAIIRGRVNRQSYYLAAASVLEMIWLTMGPSMRRLMSQVRQISQIQRATDVINKSFDFFFRLTVP